MLIDIASVNQAVPGAYRATLEVYGSRQADFRALIYRFTRDGDTAACACDLVVHAVTGHIFARDFERRTDGYWRDSDGNVCESLAGLFPAEIRGLQLEQTIDLKTIEVTA
jgi:hypothetical protein